MIDASSGEIGLLAELVYERARFEAVLRQVPTGLVVIDAEDANVVLSNDYAADLVGLPSGTTGVPSSWDATVFDLQGRRLGRALGLARRALSGEGEWRGEVLLERVDGGRSRIAGVVAPVRDETDQLIAGLLMFVDVTETRRNELLLEILADIGAAMARLDDLDGSLDRILAAITPAFCDRCILLVERDDALSELAFGAQDPAPSGLQQRVHVVPEAVEAHEGWERLRGGERLTSTRGSLAATHLDLRSFADVLGVRDAASASLVVLPLCTGGRFRGALVFASRSVVRRLDDADVRVARRLTDRIAAGVEQRSLHRAVLDHAARNERLRRLSESLAVANTVRETADAIVDHGATVLGVAVLGLAVRGDGDGGGGSRSGRGGGSDEESYTRAGDPVLAAAAAERLDQLAGAPPIGAARGGLVASIDGRYSTMTLWLGRRLVGAVAIGSSGPEPHGPSNEAHHALIEQSAQALERARLFDRQRSVATTLQRALLPQALPQLHGIALSSQYRPGGREVDVGGDWYDAFALPGGRVGLVIGDVAGRGAAAAAVMGHVRTTVSALAREGADPGVVLERADHHLQTTYGSGEMVTCCYLVLDAGDGTLRYANAGHLPPVLVWPTDVTLLGGALGPPLGLISDASRSTIQVDVPDGATLVLYTDGLVERRSQSIDNGLARLRAAVHALRRQRFDATTILNLFPDATDDDVAVLVVGIDVPHPLQIEFPARTHELSSVRARLDEWLARLGAAAHERFDIVIAVHEAAANAVVHAYRDRPGYLVTIDARYRAGEVVIAVRDHGEWFARPEDHDGRGLDLINGLVDADVDHGLFGTTVTLRRRLSFASSP